MYHDYWGFREASRLIIIYDNGLLNAYAGSKTTLTATCFRELGWNQLLY
jgi:hypothetical protein